MKLADALVEALMMLDVRYVFGVSGANIEHLHDAIFRRGGSRLSSIMAKSEDGAAFMADCHARVNRTLGVCCATSGGGMMNLIAGVAEANQSSVPLLALVGQPPANVEGRGAFQDSSGIGRSVDALQLFSAVSKYTRRVGDASSFWDSLREAVVAARGGRPGAAVLLFPRTVYSVDVGEVPPAFADTIKALISPAQPDPEQVRTLIEELRGARRPVLVIGQGAQRTSDPRPLLEFADAIDIPVVTTMAARGEFPNEHRNYLGVLGVAGHPSAHAFIRDECDLLLIAGAGLNTMTRAPFARDAVDLPEKRVIAVTADAGELFRVVEPKLRPASGAPQPTQGRSWWPKAISGISLAIQGDLAATFSVVNEALKAAPFKVRARGDYVLTTFKPTRAPSTPRPAEAANRPPGEAPLLQSQALERLAEHLPETGSLIYDAGNCAAAALHTIPVPSTIRSVIALGMGGMGYAVAGAIGAQLGSPPGTRTVVFTGDGSFLMVGMEVHTAVDLRLPILFVVFNNNMHGMCATRQHIFFDARFECVSYSRVDVATVARGLGGDRIWTATASTDAELEAALADFHRDPFRPGVLELKLDVEELPPFTPFLETDAPTQMSIPPPSSRRTY